MIDCNDTKSGRSFGSSCQHRRTICNTASSAICSSNNGRSSNGDVECSDELFPLLLASW